MSIANAKKKAWEVFSKYIRNKDANWKGLVICITCSTIKNVKEIHAGHWVHGSTKRSFLLEENVNPQCRSCNFFKDGARDVYAIKLEEKYGHGILQKIHDANKNKNPWTLKELEKIREIYEVKLKQLPYEF